MSLVLLTRVMKLAIMLAEAAQIVWMIASVIGKHKHGYVSQQRLGYTPRPHAVH